MNLRVTSKLLLLFMYDYIIMSDRLMHILTEVVYGTLSCFCGLFVDNLNNTVMLHNDANKYANKYV